MLSSPAGSLRLFRALGIDVFVHWSWFVVAYIQYMLVGDANIAFHFSVYISLFAIVLLHEFGHALACRSVGGKADRIVLWPLGGIAYVQPPPRPWPHLWSIAAGPLVNVVLLPVTLAAMWAVGLDENLGARSPLQLYVLMIASINLLLLVFNLLPIYPLDGGQLLQSVLWMFVGRTKSLLWSAKFGLGCAVVIGIFMLWLKDYWLVAMAIFIGMQSWRGIQIARMMAAYEQQQRFSHIIEPWQR